jgi:hypothetical protein
LGIKSDTDQSKEDDSDTSQESQQKEKKMSLLDKVNEIIKSCVKLKDCKESKDKK